MIIVIDDLNLLSKNGVQQMLAVQHGLLENGHLYVKQINYFNQINLIFLLNSVQLHVVPVFNDVQYNVTKMVDQWINLNVHNQHRLNNKHVHL
jgi:hypothetical protein